MTQKLNYLENETKRQLDQQIKDIQNENKDLRNKIGEQFDNMMVRNDRIEDENNRKLDLIMEKLGI